MYSACRQSGNWVSTPPTHNADRGLKDTVEIKPRFNSHGPEFPAPIQFESDSVHGLYTKNHFQKLGRSFGSSLYEGEFAVAGRVPQPPKDSPVPTIKPCGGVDI
jgi:hypothetical protein